MTRTIAISIVAFIFIAGAWCVNLVCYNPIGQSLDPLSQISTLQ